MTVAKATKGELLSSLSHALDLVEGQPEGHSVRTCLIAMEIGRELGLDESTLTHLFHASLLKDAGCSNNSARIHKIFGGDELLCKSRVKFNDWSNPFESLRFGIEYSEYGQGIVQKLRRMAQNIKPPKQIMAEVTLARCSRGAMIALDLGFDAPVAEAIRNLDEHWDGRGAPTEMKGEEIPILARILCLAQTFEVFVTAFGLEAAYEMLQKRNRRWFDPELSRIAFSLKGNEDLWRRHSSGLYYSDIEHLAPSGSLVAMERDVDRICEAYASIIDAKSTFTGDHSTRVTEYAVGIGQQIGLSRERLRTLKRAALLHDIGKLGVSNQILEKPGKLTDDEFSVIKQHPKHSYHILKPISGFEDIADIASCHHEKLDGKGYWRGVSAENICLEARCLAVADILDALHAKRPYRDAMPMSEAFAILDKQAGTAIDPDCLQAAKEVYGNAEPMLAAA